MAVIKDDSRCPVSYAIGEKLRWLQDNDPSKLKQVLQEMEPEMARNLIYNDDAMLRDKQWIDLASPYTVHVVLAGRGLT